METLTLCPGESQAGRRADVWLAEAVEGLTRSAAQKLLEDGAVLCNGESVRKNRKTAPRRIGFR